jgi:Tfp pilus assembly protein PilN
MKDTLGIWTVAIIVIAFSLLGLKACTQVESKESIIDPTVVPWTPTEEDQLYLDSLWNIVNNTQHEVDTIKVDIQTIMIRLDQLHDAQHVDLK